MDISWLSNFNMFNVAATAAGVWVFVSNWWIVILLAVLWLVARGSPRDKGDKENTLPKHLPTKDEVVDMLKDLYLK